MKQQLQPIISSSHLIILANVKDNVLTNQDNPLLINILISNNHMHIAT